MSVFLRSSPRQRFFSQPGELFRETGCAHSCAFWKEREIVCSFEDIGRHNALDKVAGKLLIQEIDPGDGVIFTSGRISADYLKKIIQMGVATVVSRAAVTEAAVLLAEKYGILLLGFVRNHTGNFMQDSYSFFYFQITLASFLGTVRS